MLLICDNSKMQSKKKKIKKALTLRGKLICFLEEKSVAGEKLMRFYF
jgi:hypothetical protein